MASELTLLVDTSSLVYRALFSNPDSITASDGTPVNAAFGFLGMLARLVRDQDPGFVACATDENWRPVWRTELLPAYKSARTLPDSPGLNVADRSPLARTLGTSLERLDASLGGKR